MQASQREAVLEELARNQHEHVKIEGNGGHLGGAVTEEDVRTFVREFQVDQVRFPLFFARSQREDDPTVISIPFIIRPLSLKGAT